MLVKTAQLTSTQLNHAVAKCEEQRGVKFGTGFSGKMLLLDKYEFGHRLGYSTDWAQGGPIIEREKITVQPVVLPNGWMARNQKDGGVYEGPTPLIAAMRCYVASKFGNEIEISNNLCRT